MVDRLEVRQIPFIRKLTRRVSKEFWRNPIAKSILLGGAALAVAGTLYNWRSVVFQFILLLLLCLGLLTAFSQWHWHPGKESWRLRTAQIGLASLLLFAAAVRLGQTTALKVIDQLPADVQEEMRAELPEENTFAVLCFIVTGIMLLLRGMGLSEIFKREYGDLVIDERTDS